ncbi:hypothetical protein BK138_32255 [Paenibacillus rhizosphaerae]|uniref:Uncharacterized protein n=1 Tax=Paenibacillus rhizosphaerae TaxID=297318 RepID=A0A1R1E676_9BACL|nr:hypothetical protein [Paenibacillus rhizosphaerae]OMF47309.1 hypothetical protein BK138_32255 [Paenibacillus rhizosphaerae]
MYRELLMQGKLEQALYAAQEMTKDVMIGMIQQGMDYQEAWEAVRQNWILLPDEETMPILLGSDPAGWTAPENV